MNETDYEREMPANVDVERTILGAILLDNEAFYDDSFDLTADDFFLESHRRLYRAMNDILFGEVPGVSQVDIVTLSDELRNRKEIEFIGGVAYLASLTEGLPRRPVIGEYVRILKEKSKLRKTMAVLAAGIARAQDQSESSERITSEIGDKLIEIEAENSAGPARLGSIEVESEIREKRNFDAQRTSLELSWGITNLDDFTHGCFKGEWTIFAGESSGGKTAAFIQTMIENAMQGIPCGFFSMEMTKEQVKKRCYSHLGESITASHIRDPRLMNAHTHLKEMEALTSKMASLPIYIDDTSSLRIDRLIARMRMMRRKLGVQIFGVDYLQLIEPMPKQSPSEGFKRVVHSLRDFPKMEPDCHLVVLSQYSKADGFTKSKKRTKDSLYGGSIIHHAAQNIFMITIEDPEKRDPRDLLDVEIRIAKQREGPRGKVNCFFDRDHLRFCEPQPPLTGG